MSEKFPVLTIDYTSTTVGFGTPSVTAFASGNSKSFTGIEDRIFDRSTSLYPNPSSQKITLECGDAGLFLSGIEILDVTGRSVLKLSEPPAQKITFSVEGLQPGVYFVNYFKGTNKNATRLVVE
jgi:hypothetical protein